MPGTATKLEDKHNAMGAYKAILRDVLDARPSGTRQRLATALGKNRSFITQIANGASSVPVPAQHLSAIFELCHFSASEREAFIAAYHIAHPRRLLQVVAPPATRDAVLHLPDLRDQRRNRLLDMMLTEMAKNVAQMLRED